ncbi:aminopeptidase [Desulfosporosinus metallidurans]|uniref:Leucyl aminopeptidase n=1 Tax=Desulfosporosinus metallidurans TaxID=1888891 RepID=A0A1Q8QXB7_9FIRM|nr:aminopeptidase [Desulfosporosinus metallidurans]OLN31978.1 Leucyl aminopeptidase [Desulfosporosinus metallidurans]
MSLKKGSQVVLRDCLNVRPGEKVLIVSDDEKLKIGQALYEEAQSLGAEGMLMVMKPRAVNGEEPPEPVAKAMAAADVVICPTVSSLTHTNARIQAVKRGARVATMPGITEEMFSEGAITADYNEVQALTLKVTELLTKAETVKIIKDGFVLAMSLKGRKGVPSTGVYRDPGTSGNLPSGEAYIAPIEGTAQGETVIDGSMVGIGKLCQPLHVKILDGKLVEMRGQDADKVQILFANERNASLGELGIGTNPQARLSGVILEDEKVYGTVHIAFGTNTSFGGTVKADCHLDGIILKPDVYFDDICIIAQGEFII